MFATTTGQKFWSAATTALDGSGNEHTVARRARNCQDPSPRYQSLGPSTPRTVQSPSLTNPSHRHQQTQLNIKHGSDIVLWSSAAQNTSTSPQDSVSYPHASPATVATTTRKLDFGKSTKAFLAQWKGEEHCNLHWSHMLTRVPCATFISI